MKKKHLVWGGVVATLAVAISVMATLDGHDELLEVQTAVLARETIVQRVNAPGRIQPKTQVRISADISSKITSIRVAEGDWVEEGELLVELDRERYQAAVESAEASVRSAQANAKLVLQNKIKTEKDFHRSKDLVARNLESISTLDAVEAAYQVEVARYEAALDQVEQARAMLKQARDDLSKTTIYAPMSGTISDLNKEEGEIAIGSQFQEDLILVIANLHEMEAVVNVDENDIVGVEIGQSAEIRVDALFGEVLSGTVYEISNTANEIAPGDNNRKTEFEVKVAVTSATDDLRPGMTATADIITATKTGVVAIPIQSVAVRTLDQLTGIGQQIEDISGDYKPDDDGFVEILFVVVDGRAIARQIETGIQSDDLIELVSGVAEGDEIVTGSYKAISRDIVNGAPVAVNNGTEKGDGDV